MNTVQYSILFITAHYSFALRFLRW